MAASNLQKPILLILPPLLIIATSITAQITDNNNNNYSKPELSKFHPTMAVIAAIFISAAVLAGIYCYSRSFLNISPNIFESAAASLLGRQKSGLDAAVLRSFPVMLYADVKDLKIGSASLECAVCINEFGDEDSIRLLPGCSHVFHEECIDAWLASHVTCPVCRAVLGKGDAGESPAAAAEELVEVVVVAAAEEEERRKDLERIRSRSRRPGGGRRQRKLMRAHTTGRMAGEDLERYTLRLPEAVRNDIFAAGRLRRERSLPARGDEGSGGRRSLVRGLSAKWPSFFLRS